MDENNKNKQQEEYLSKFLTETKEEIIEIKQSLKQQDNGPSSLEYLSIDLKSLPLGEFYQEGFSIKIRSAKVFEVQAYSVVDDKNPLDVTEKMNQLLASCTKVILPNGKQGSYKDIKDGDRLYIIFMIRELTFQKGNSLAKEVNCTCGHEFSIPFRATSNPEYPKTFMNHEMNETLKRFFNPDLKCFELEIDGAIYRLAPPTIGIQEICFGDLKTKFQNQKTPNVSFLKIIPYVLYDRTTITEDGIKAKEDEFKKMPMEVFQIINSAVGKMIFGLKGLKMVCPECGLEVHTDMTFPLGASSLFVVPDYFDKFAKK